MPVGYTQLAYSAWVTRSGAEESRTPDLIIANDALYQLSYRPNRGESIAPHPRTVMAPCPLLRSKFAALLHLRLELDAPPASAITTQTTGGHTRSGSRCASVVSLLRMDYQTLRQAAVAPVEPSFARRVASATPRSPLLLSAFMLLFVALASLSGFACERPSSRVAQRPAGPMRVVVTLPPLEGLVRPLLPADATIRVLIPPGRSEHGYEPTVEDVLALEGADVVVLVGMGLESSVDTALRKRPRPYRHEARLGVILGLEDAHGGHGHDEHAHDAHAHDEHAHEHADEAQAPDPDAHDHAHAVDPHVWLDPVLMKQALPEIARLIKASLTESARGNAAAVDPAVADTLARIAAVDAAYRSGLEPLTGRAIVTHHAAFGRLADRYGLRVVEVIRPIEGAEPTPANIAQVSEAIVREGVHAIFVEPQFDARGAQLIAEKTGVRLGTLDPLGSGDWFAMMESNLRELIDKLGP
jgi:zinc transport system substrate-binding protein